MGRADSLGRGHRVAAVAAAHAQRQAGPLRQPARPPRRLRLLRATGHQPLRRRDVRAGPGAWATAIPRLVVSPGHAQRRRAAGIQPPECCGRAAPGAAGTRASPHRLPVGRLRRASHDARDRGPASRLGSRIMGPQRALLVIADIGGYTEYMRTHRMSLAHAEVNTARLLEAVIDAAGDFELIEIEGD